jgi:hypothetical protein
MSFSDRLSTFYISEDQSLRQLMKGIQACSNEGQCHFPKGNNSKNVYFFLFRVYRLNQCQLNMVHA